MIDYKMPKTQLESILNFLNLSLEEICERSDIEESHLYRLLSLSAEPDSYTLEKLSNTLCISRNEILKYLKLSRKKLDNVIIYPAFTSFYKPFYIFKLCAYEDISGVSLNKHLSFIPEDFNVEYRVLQGQITVYDSQDAKIYNSNSTITFPYGFEEEEYIADMTKSTVMIIRISA